MFELLPYGATIDLQCISCSKEGVLINDYTSSTTYSTITDDLGKNNCYFLESIQGPTTMTFSYTEINGTLVGIDTNLTVLNSNFGADGSGTFTITNEGFDPDEHESKPEGDIIEEIERPVQTVPKKNYLYWDGTFSSMYGTIYSWRWENNSGSEIRPIAQEGYYYYFDPKYTVVVQAIECSAEPQTVYKKTHNKIEGGECYISISNSNNIEKLLDKNNNRNIIPNDKYTIEQNKIIIDSQYEGKTIIIVYNYGESHVINKKAPYIRLLFNKVKVECCFVNVDGLGTYSQNGWNDLKIDKDYIKPGSYSAQNYCQLQRYVTVSWSTNEENQLMISELNNNRWYQAFFDTLDSNDIPTGFGYGDTHRIWSVDSLNTQDSIEASKVIIPPLNGTSTLGTENIILNKYFKIGYSINFHGESKWKSASSLSINGNYYNYNLSGTFEHGYISEKINSNNSSPSLSTHPKNKIWGENSKFYITNSGKYISPANGIQINSQWETTDYCIPDTPGCPCQQECSPQCPCQQQCSPECPCQCQSEGIEYIYCQNKYTGGATGDRYFKQGENYYPVGTQVFVSAGWYEIIAAGPIVKIGSEYNDYAKVYYYNTTGSDTEP